MILIQIKMILINSLILFFLFLIGYQIFLALTPNVEGLESNAQGTANANANYKPYNMNDPNNALILGQQNAGNIENLRGRVDALDGVKSKVDTMQTKIDAMQVQMDALVQQQASFANDINGGKPVNISTK
jgi:hypothetical protein